MSKKYWCPTCGDLESFVFLGIANAIQHRDGCTLREIPVVEPLDVPEVTTWGESGGAEAVTIHSDGPSTVPWWMLGDNNARVVDNYHCGNTWYMTGRSLRTGDVVTAINYVAGVRR